MHVALHALRNDGIRFLFSMWIPCRKMKEGNMKLKWFCVVGEQFCSEDRTKFMKPKSHSIHV